jgi:hypothetical protein
MLLRVHGSSERRNPNKTQKEREKRFAHRTQPAPLPFRGHLSASKKQ